MLLGFRFLWITNHFHVGYVVQRQQHTYGLSRGLHLHGDEKSETLKTKKNRPKRNQPPLREATRIDEYLNRLGRGE